MNKPACRVDGWTPARRDAFIAAIERGERIGPAASAAGMSRQSAHRLRARDPGFAARWTAASATWAAAAAARAADERARGETLLDLAFDALDRVNPVIAKSATLTPGQFDRWLMRRLRGARASMRDTIL